MPDGRGITSTGAYGDTLQSRVTREEYMLIEKVARAEGLTVSMFVRSVAYYAAVAIDQEKVSHDGMDMG